MAQNYVVGYENGLIDWTNGVIEGFGNVRAPESFENDAQARSVAKARAIAEARRNLLNILEEIQVTSGQRLKDLEAINPALEREVRSAIQGAYLSDLSFLGGGAAKAAVSMRIFGALSELIIPSHIKPIAPIEEQTSKRTLQPGFTGLVLDCRGLKQMPLLVPKVLDEEGAEVYGPAYASRENVVRFGMAGWIRGVEHALKDWRAGERPLVIKAISPPPGAKDIRLANADAERIRKDARNVGLMRECRVLIVID